jgi:hypothetical protein
LGCECVKILFFQKIGFLGCECVKILFFQKIGFLEREKFTFS